MLFNSFEFILLFLPPVLFISARLCGNALLRWIGLSSIFFYAFAGHVWFIIPMLVTTIVDFLAAKKIDVATAVKVRQRWLALSLCSNLGLLAYFKYSALLLSSLSFVGGVHSPWLLSLLNVTLPAGISFYTFQTLSYIIDVYRGECRSEKNFIKFACFVSFFPHLVAGPLTRHNQLIPALTRIADRGIEPRWQAGFYLFAVGLCKKMILGDNLGRLVDTQLTDFHQLGFFNAWIILLGYSLQIYFDFSGYSDMAIGLGRFFGVELPQNFNEPYRALNPSDFWARWHITLSLWLRDYLYISLGGNRCSTLRRYINLLITMFLGGLWHGASWTFAAWGMFHGVFLIFYHCNKLWWDSLNPRFQMFFNFIVICLAWVFFRSDSFLDATLWFRGLFGLNGLGLNSINNTMEFLAFLGLGFFSIHGLRKFYSSMGEYSTSAQVALAMLTGIAVLLMNNSSKFLYFQF